MKDLLKTALGEDDVSLKKVLQSAKKDLKDAKFQTNEHTFDANVEQTQEQEQQIEREQEREQEVEQERDIDINYLESDAAPRVQAETGIDIGID
jgi:hypothetical protein